MPHTTGPSHGERAGSPGERAVGSSPSSAGARISNGEADRRAVDRVLAGIKEAGVQQVELQFADVTGAVKTVAVPARRIAAVLADGEWFDGSAIEGLAREVESDMYLRPDPTTFAVMEPAGVICARLICEVVTPSGEP
jgi:glutamine synthetase